MQSIMNATYPSIAIEAIIGGFDGSWERLIAKRLEKDYNAYHSEAIEIVNSVFIPGESLTKASLKAAYLITSSKIAECHT